MVGEKHHNATVQEHSLISHFFSEKCGGGGYKKKTLDFFGGYIRKAVGGFLNFLRGWNGWRKITSRHCLWALLH
jgi:hypothetical protein